MSVEEHTVTLTEVNYRLHEPTFRRAEEHPKGWGKEVWLANNERYCGKLLHFNKGATFSAHFHGEKIESFYLLTGKIRFVHNDPRDAHAVIREVNVGEVIDIPRFCVHQVEALEESVIIEVSTTHREHDSYRVRKGDSQK